MRFSNGQEAFPLTTAAQKIHVFLRKSPLHKKHFFEWLKTANISIACGTSTLKSLLPQGAYAPHVHPRLRKRLARCTLDCGFKTSESPALRGFVGERGRFATTSLYLVLKSNGLRHSKNLPEKFGFLSKSTSTNIAKKLPSQLPTQSVFQLLAQTAHVCFTGKSGYTLAFQRKIAHGGSHAETGAFRMGGWYHYPRSVPHIHKHPRAGYQNDVLCRFWALVRCAPEERREPAGQRCAHARRCSEASRPRRAALPCCRCSFNMIWRDRKT